MLPNNTKFEETAMKTKLHFSVVQNEIEDYFCQFTNYARQLEISSIQHSDFQKGNL